MDSLLLGFAGGVLGALTVIAGLIVVVLWVAWSDPPENPGAVVQPYLDRPTKKP
jgi:hypothetical protein